MPTKNAKTDSDGFTAQERFMNVEPEEVNRVPTLEELEAYFEETRVA